jgi:hypothetical protein
MKLARPIPRWRERQIAARHDAQEEGSLARLALLMDLQGEDATDAASAIVGYAQPSPATLKMVEHLCAECSRAFLKLADGYVPVYRHQIAATMPCVHCGRALEAAR